MRRVLLLLSFIAVLGGCISLPGGPAAPVYVLSDGAPAALPVRPARPQVVRVEAFHANVYDDNIHLVYSRTPDTRGLYRFALWSELPSSRLTALLFNRLDESGIYATVLNAHSDADSDQTLSSELLDCYHDAATAPGVVVLRVRESLYDTRAHRLLARKVFTERVAVTRFDAAGAAAAFNQASRLWLDAVSAWLLAQPDASS